MVEEVRQKYNKTAIDHSLPDSSRAYIIIQPAEGVLPSLSESGEPSAEDVIQWQ
jgi:hypothetical protein